MRHFPEPGSLRLHWAGDVLDVTLELNSPRPGRAVFRTNIGLARIQRRETIASTESGEPALARDWHDLPMARSAPGRFTLRVPLTEVGVFAGKACFFPENSGVPEWPAGENLRVKVLPARAVCANTIYTAFTRQFGSALSRNPHTPENAAHAAALDNQGYTVIPPSGTFRDLIRKLDTIMDTMGFRIVQLLPVHPTPTTYARMGRFGSPFAARDFLAIDPALVEFDRHTTPLDQFRELADAIHSRHGLLMMDLPANHTGWAATMQNHHPEWYARKDDGEFLSPGAWGVVWADLVELDYRDPALRAYMAEVFLFWCRQGADGFRCDAGYMIPRETWRYIVARVRQEFPDTIFLLEGLGGKVEVTRSLLAEANLDWAYSELFQTMDRPAFEWYLPRAIEMAEQCGTLVNFAETHDNNRLAASGHTFAQLRVMLSAMLSHQGGFGITNGVEWFASEKIEVHGANALNWGDAQNQVDLIQRLNTLLAAHPAFGPHTRLRLVTRGTTPTVAVARFAPDRPPLLILVNLECHHPQVVEWDGSELPGSVAWDLLAAGDSGIPCENSRTMLQPGAVLCLTWQRSDLDALRELQCDKPREPSMLAHQRRNLMAMRVRQALGTDITRFTIDKDPDELGQSMTRDPVAFCAPSPEAMPSCAIWQWPRDARREVVVPAGHLLLVLSDHHFRAALDAQGERQDSTESIQLDSGKRAGFLSVAPYDTALAGQCNEERQLDISVYTTQGAHHAKARIIVPPPPSTARVATAADGARVRQEPDLCAVLSNGAGAMSRARAAWGCIASQYDALLALNLDPSLPVDKTIFWTHCRVWLRYRGYSQEINEECQTGFSCDPAGTRARWEFEAPCGMGLKTALSFTLELTPQLNRATLSITRLSRDSPQEPEDEVTLIARPDIEWRSFHHQTKAFEGAEHNWPAAIRPDARGFTFAPHPDHTVAIRCSHGKFHHEPQWRYMVEHPEEAQRGLEPHGDLFSPGWFSLPLARGATASLVAGEPAATPSESSAPSKPSDLFVPPHHPLDILPRSLDLYIVRRGELRTVIAGYPWFLDWGRDTLIALRGMIAAERLEESLDILREFGRYEEQGTLPNIIHGHHVGNRDTSDAPLWFCVAAGDLMEAMGDTPVLEALCGQRTLREVMLSILTHYRDGTPNRIRMDSRSGLVFSPAHYTWMDTNYPAATPRQGYPVEIQALWIASLRLMARKTDAVWSALAEQAALSLSRLFALPEGWLADCLDAAPGTPAANALPVDALRPNQLLAITLDTPLPRELKRGAVRACGELLVPGGIRSLADRPTRAALPVYHQERLLNNPHHPFQGVYGGDEDTQRKPAYHNGTAWTWQFPLYAEALAMAYPSVEARQTGLSLLASSIDLLSGGCPGHVPEIMDGNAPHTPRGCVAQAWGVSELLRVWKKLAAER